MRPSDASVWVECAAKKKCNTFVGFVELIQQSTFIQCVVTLFTLLSELEVAKVYTIPFLAQYYCYLLSS